MKRRANDQNLLDVFKKHKTTHIDSSIKFGDVLTDLNKNKWVIGDCVGSGAFGDIYFVTSHNKCLENSNQNIEYVAKIEKHDSGPLFVEINCYLRLAKLNMIQQWLEKNKQTEIGIPHYIASGSHYCRSTNEKFRFLIIPKYSYDLETIFRARNKQFDVRTVFTLAIQILDILEYFHSKGYVHSDIKGSNLLLGLNKRMETMPNDFQVEKKPNRTTRKKRKPNRQEIEKVDKVCFVCEKKHLINTRQQKCVNFTRQQNNNQVYLLDYGLANKYKWNNGQHKEYCPDERRAHAGTILFCSRDAHDGCVSRRSDLENLGYLLIYWLVSKLPWEGTTTNYFDNQNNSESVDDPEMVHMKKCEFMKNIDDFLNYIFDYSYPKCLLEYFNYINSLKFTDEPNYHYCRKLFLTGFKQYNYMYDNCLYFNENVDIKKKSTLMMTAVIAPVPEKPDLDISLINLPLLGNITNVSNITTKKKTLRSMKQKAAKKSGNKFNWAEVIESDPEKLFREDRKNGNCNNLNGNNKRLIRKQSSTDSSLCYDPNIEYLLSLNLDDLNPTYAMLDVLRKVKMKIFNNNAEIAPHQDNYFVYNNKGDSIPTNIISKHKGFTPIMAFIKYKSLLRKTFEMQSELRNDRFSFYHRLTRLGRQQRINQLVYN